MFCFSESSDRIWAPTTSYSIGKRCYILVDKRQGRKAGRSPPSIAEFKNVWRYPPLPHMLSCCGAQLYKETLTALLEDIAQRTRKFMKLGLCLKTLVEE